MDQPDQGRFNIPGDEYLTAKEAADLLGVKVESVYAYASRGRLKSHRIPAARGRRYLRAEVERLRTRSRARAGHAAVASAALRWGEPVLDSSITAIDDNGPRYRGSLAIELAEDNVPFECVVQLLTTGKLPKVQPTFRVHGLGAKFARLSLMIPKDTPPLTALSLVLPVIAAHDLTRFNATDTADIHRGHELLIRLAASLCLGVDARRCSQALEMSSVERAMLCSFGLRDTERLRGAINAALVLCADHELNTSTFAARVAASAGADLYACIGAALGTLSGPKHGGACDRIEALVSEAERPELAHALVNERFRRGESVPGFGHPLYPDGDPRTLHLLVMARSIGSDKHNLQTLFAVIDAMSAAGREAPTMDTGLVALALSLDLLPGSAAGIFAVGRAAGWIAHIIEQRQQGFLLRPRARYVGV